MLLSRRKLKKSCELDVPTQQVYEVVSDVKSYEQFVPYCVKSKILHKRSSLQFDAELQIGFRLFNESHVSRVTCKKPEGKKGGFVKAEALPGGLCDALISVWSFKPTKTGGCNLSFNVDFEISNPLHAAAIAGFFEQVTLQQMTAFSERAIQLHREKTKKKGKRTELSRGEGGGRDLDVLGGRHVGALEEGTPRRKDAVSLSSVFEERKVQLEKNYLNEEEESSDVLLGLGLPEFLLCCNDLASKKIRPFPRLCQNTFLLASCFASFDKDGDGIVDKSNWISGCQLLSAQDPEQKARMLHTYFDHDSDGYVNASDVSNALKGHLKSMSRLLPEILRMQERQKDQLPSESSGSFSSVSRDKGGAAEGGGDPNQTSNMLVLCATMDVLLDEAQEEVSDFVDNLFNLIDDKKTNRISCDTWVGKMKEHPELMNLMFLEGFLEMRELALVTKESVNP